MQSHARGHVLALTDILSAISLAFVFGFRRVLGTLPVRALARASAGITDTTSVNAIISLSPEAFVE